MGFDKAEKSMSPKERDGPAKMIVTTAYAMKPLTLAQYAPKTSPHPFVDRSKGGFIAMLEVFKPAFTDQIASTDDLTHAPSICSSCNSPQLLSEPLFTFRGG